MITKLALDKIMDALMLRHWGIFSIDRTTRKGLKRANFFNAFNSLLNLAEYDSEDSMDKTVLAIAVPYALEGVKVSSHKNRAKVEAFGWDFDYHVQVKILLNQVKADLEALHGQTLKDVTVCVDNSPYNDREVGFYAGLGQVGYNHLLINRQLGSNFFIGYLVIHEKLPIEPSALVTLEDLPMTTGLSYCETCRRCEQACPSHVCGFKEADMSACLSAQTQNKGIINVEMRLLIHNRLYGCSICQSVCPLNHYVTPHPLLTLKAENWVDALALLEMTHQNFMEIYGHMGFAWRPLWVYKRNALIVIGNIGDQDALDLLSQMPHLNEDHKLAMYYRWAIQRLIDRINEQSDTINTKID